MVEIPVEELAIIFEPDFSEGYIGIVPIDVVAGYYDEEEDKFIDTNLYTYSHATYGECGRSYALRTKISQLLSQYPDADLNKLKNILFDECSKYKYFNGYYNDEPVILIQNVETNEINLLMDEDTEANLMLVLDEEEFNEVFASSDNYDKDNIIPMTEDLPTSTKKEKNNINPHKLYKEIAKVVKGQDDAIKKIVTIIWKNYTNTNSSARNMIVLGSSGVGKTEIFRQISKLLDIPLLIVGVSGMSQAGYKGTGTDEILSSLLTLTKGDIQKAERAIVILDEIDKLAYSGSESGKISTDGVQNELLKIVEDGDFAVEYNENGFPIKKMLNTSHITFVGVGAFTNTLTTRKEKQVGFGNDIFSKEISKEKIVADDLIGFGIKPELVGRMGEIIKLNNLTLDILADIIKNSNNSAYVSNIKFISEIIPKFIRQNEDEIINEIATIAVKNSNKIGARGLSSIIENMFSEVLFDISDPDVSYKELEITKEIVTNSKCYTLRK